MPINFFGIGLGQDCNRRDLAKRWGYQDHNAIRRGVVTPRGDNQAVFFITGKKDENAVQYEDYFDGKKLKIDGEEEHKTDKRIIEISENQGAFHLFYRETNKTDFTYHGKMKLQKYELRSDKPSIFEFEINKE